MTLLGLVVLVLVVCVVIWATRALIAAFSVPQPLAQVIIVLVVLVCLLYVLSAVGIPLGLRLR